MNFKLLTPQQTMIDEDIQNAVIPGAEGYIGFLEGHVPYVTPVKTGIVEISGDKGSHSYAVTGGYCEFSAGGIVVLAEYAQAALSINVEEARADLKTAEDKMANAGEDADLTSIKRDIEWAEIRLELAQVGKQQ